jgi:hypothetical protein
LNIWRPGIEERGMFRGRIQELQEVRRKRPEA